jgi:hypothetical protein
LIDRGWAKLPPDLAERLKQALLFLAYARLKVLFRAAGSLEWGDLESSALPRRLYI